MTTVRFLNGLTTIGGNIVEIANKSSRVIFDFGTTTGPIEPHAIEQAIKQNDLPNLPALFTGEKTGFDHEAIFISHLHLDHTGALPLLKSDIPVYMSQATYNLYQVLLKQGLARPMQAKLKVLPLNQPLKIGDLSVTGFASDHDIVGIMALLVSDGKNQFGYSADVRLHGPNVQLVKDWMSIFKAQNLALLMLEGTAFSFDDRPKAQRESELSELAIQQRLEVLAQTTNNLLAVSLYPRNVERLIRFNQAVNKTGRRFVWEASYANVIAAFTQDEQPLLVLAESTDGVTLDERFETVNLAAIQKNPAQYVLQNDFQNLAFLKDFEKVHYLHSNGEPLGDYDPRYQQLLAFLKTNDFTFEQLLASGHATKADLVEIAREVAAKQTVLWHSFHPELEAKALKTAKVPTQTVLPVRGQVFHF